MGGMTTGREPAVPARPGRAASRWLLRGLALIGALLAISVALALVLLLRPVPPRSGSQRLRGLSAPVIVVFDETGVPDVRAATEEDAFRALGWLHAADRLFQMEMRRRASHGRLAEVLGEAFVPMDVAARRDGHAASALSDLEVLDLEERALLQAYAEGVNAYVKTHARPLELLALGVEPEPWTPVDSLAFGRFLMAGLSDAAEREVGELRRRGLLDSDDGTAVLADEEAREAPAGDDEPSGGGGSNAWAVSGLRAASGSPILANDPHLAAEWPGVWYAARLRADDGLDCAGLTLPGIPGIVIGHNGRVAWGIAMAEVDDADLFEEVLDPTRRAYRRGDRWVSLESREETIRIRGVAERKVRFFATDRGTLLGRIPGAGAEIRSVARRFAPAEAPTGIVAFWKASRAADAAELEAAWAHYRGTAINVCWASLRGAIGVRLAGSVPIRAAPPEVPSRDDWVRVAGQGDLPRIVDPPEGFVATANDDWSAAGRKLPFAGSYASGDRVGRIRELLAPLRAATPADMNAIQTDVLSSYALRIVGSILGIEPRDDEARRAVDILRAWDGRAERRGRSRLFYEVLRQLATTSRFDRWATLDAALLGPAAEWDDPGTPRVETRDDAVSRALASALERVEREDGTDPERWNWGRTHTLRYVHPFSSRIPLPLLRRPLDVGPLELPGEVHTVQVQGFRLAGEPRIRHIASARIVVDLGNPDASTLVLPLGQSGQFQDSHYDDQARSWAGGTTFPFPFRRSAVDATSASTLRLVP